MMCPHIQPRRHQLGISMIEAMIALIVLSGGLLALSKFQGQLFKSVASSTQRSEALALGQQMVDSYRATQATKLDNVVTTCPISGSNNCTGSFLAPGTGTPTSLASASGNSYTTTWRMSSTPTSSGASSKIYRLEVKVAWSDTTGNQSLVVVGLISPL